MECTVAERATPTAGLRAGADNFSLWARAVADQTVVLGANDEALLDQAAFQMPLYNQCFSAPLAALDEGFDSVGSHDNDPLLYRQPAHR